jgi:hypothetical protein
MRSQKFTKVLLPTTHGGHFYMAENRTFLLCVDIWALSVACSVEFLYRKGFVSLQNARRAKAT